VKNGSLQIDVWEVNNLKERKGQLGLLWKMAQEEWKVSFAPITTEIIEVFGIHTLEGEGDTFQKYNENGWMSKTFTP
jgi:hypothetical protein